MSTWSKTIARDGFCTFMIEIEEHENGLENSAMRLKQLLDTVEATASLMNRGFRGPGRHDIPNVIPTHQIISQRIKLNSHRLRTKLVPRFPSVLLVDNIWPKIEHTVEKICNALSLHILSFNIMVVDKGASDQTWHCDNLEQKTIFDATCASYYTLIVPLTENAKSAGGTEILCSSHLVHKRNAPKSKSSIIMPCNIGASYLLSGRVWHRGLKNMSDRSRIFLYVALGSEQHNTDINIT
jgi:hypothetical protein